MKAPSVVRPDSTGTGKVGRKPKRGLSSAEKVRMARMRFTIDKITEKLTSVTAVAKMFKRDPAQVTKAVNSAFREGLVEIREVEQLHKRVIRNETLEQQLKEHFPEINVRVIETADDDFMPTSAADESSHHSDRVHMYLGAALAKDLRDGLHVSDGDTIGLGSGRSVFYAIENLRHHPKLNWAGTRLVSLSGHVSATDYSGQVNGHLDADLHVNQLALCLRQKTTQILFECPITGHQIFGLIDKRSKINLLDEERRRSPVGSKWSNNRCNLAICGVGSFTSGHRFYEFINSQVRTAAQHDEDRISDSELKPIIEELRRLNDLCKRNGIESDYTYIPVGDICNHLFFIPHPSGEMRDERAIRAIIQSINGKLLNASWEQFSQIDKMIVLSGTKRKAATVLELIQNRAANAKLKIRMLYIDTDAANGMLRLLAVQREKRLAAGG